jgi:hypothetical protein
MTVVCSRLDDRTLSEFGRMAARLMQQTTTVESVRFRNDSGAWNKAPETYPDGFHLGLTVRTRDTAMWTLDIRAVDQPARQPDLAHLANLLPSINESHRRAILRIKQALAERPASREVIPSALVYEAVVDHDIRTVEQFDHWCLDRPA